MGDTSQHAERYRSNIIRIEDVRTLARSVYGRLDKKTKAKLKNIAVVFAFLGDRKPEFALVTNHWNDKQIKKDMEVMLTYGDPVGVVGVACGDANGKSAHEFQTFKGKAWAQQFSGSIIEQAGHVIPIARLF